MNICSYSVCAGVCFSKWQHVSFGCDSAVGAMSNHSKLYNKYLLHLCTADDTTLSYKMNCKQHLCCSYMQMVAIVPCVQNIFAVHICRWWQLCPVSRRFLVSRRLHGWLPGLWLGPDIPWWLCQRCRLCLCSWRGWSHLCPVPSRQLLLWWNKQSMHQLPCWNNNRQCRQ
jgi:hypothetical protein